VLADLNAALLGHPADRFSTVVCLRVRRDTQNRVKVTIATAGHPPPIRLAAEGIGPVGAPGSLLGVLDDPELHDTTIVLRPGDALFCYTDGLTEGRRGAEFFGEQRLMEALARHHGRPAAELTQAVVDEIVEFQAGAPRDDMAAVLIGVPAP
jgi:sigma-B regulation protein RsbU (phosphoserine phosphatase)